jgi:hypothetical protein
MSTGKRKSKVRLIALLIMITGALGVVAAGVTLGMVSSELKAEHLTVTAMPHERPGGLGGNQAGKPVVNPLSASVAAGMSQGNSKGVLSLVDPPDSMTNGSFLRALFTIAAIALAIAVPVMGIGVLFALVDLGPMKGSRKR